MLFWELAYSVLVSITKYEKMVGILTVCTCCMVDLKAQGREELTCFNAVGDGGSGRSCSHWELRICFN